MRSGVRYAKDEIRGRGVHNCLKITCMKTGTYALMHLTVAIAVAYALTGNWSMALAIGLIEPFVQTFAFVIHERIWNKATATPTPAGGACGEVETAIAQTRLGEGDGAPGREARTRTATGAQQAGY